MERPVPLSSKLLHWAVPEGDVLNAGSDSVGLGQGLKLCLSHRLPAMPMLLGLGPHFEWQSCACVSVGF